MKLFDLINHPIRSCFRQPLFRSQPAGALVVALLLASGGARAQAGPPASAATTQQRLAAATAQPNAADTDPAQVFQHPPEAAKPGALWMWMGSNLSAEGMTRDLEALHKAGFSSTTMFSLADVTTPWAGEIGRSPTPDILAWGSESWWRLLRHAAQESQRLHMDFGAYNGAGYEASGGTWITPEHSMQEVCWSETPVAGGHRFRGALPRPQVDAQAVMEYPIFNPETGRVEKPLSPARQTYYADVAVLALPVTGVVAPAQVLNLSSRLTPDGRLDWQAPAGQWVVYRFGHTSRGTLIQPAQWRATGLECDKMSEVAVQFHLDHMLGELRSHLGDLFGTAFTHLHFDSYEAGEPNWTPRMPAEFRTRRGYDLLPFLPTFAKRTVGSAQQTTDFKKDLRETVKDLHRDVYFATIARTLKAAGLQFSCEPYGGPWRQDDVVPFVGTVMTEFWTNNDKFDPKELAPTVAAMHKVGKNIIQAEAFTGQPKYSRWTETPAWLKPIGDEAFCEGVNRLVVHRVVQQPWDARYLPGAAMGQWGTHFDRTQTWWEPGQSLFTYWQRCQALLQWGQYAAPTPDFEARVTQGELRLKALHRQSAATDVDVYFVANLARTPGRATYQLPANGRQPELWDPVTGRMEPLLPAGPAGPDGRLSLPIAFAAAQSFFIVLRRPAGVGAAASAAPVAAAQLLRTLDGPWQVAFDPKWGGPAQPVTFAALVDWTQRPEAGIRYYSGKAVYTKQFDRPRADQRADLALDLGTVQHIARVWLNGQDLGVVWTAPWQVRLPAKLLKSRHNELRIELTNVWANRLIGDEQEPDDCTWLPGHLQGGRFLKEFPDWFLRGQARPSAGRYCFTNWNYFTKDSPLVPSGLLGPVTLQSIPAR